MNPSREPTRENRILASDPSGGYMLDTYTERDRVYLQFDLFRRVMGDGLDRAVRLSGLQSPPWEARRRILDVGCGSGLHLSDALARYPRFHCVGVDLDAEAIAGARRIWAGRKNLTFHRLDILEPLPDVLAPGIAGLDFDVAQLVFTLAHLSDAARSLGNVRRALRPGGVLWLFDATERGVELPHPSLRVLWSARESLIGRAGTRRAAERHQELLESAGFEVLESAEVDEPMGGITDRGRMALAAMLLALRSARQALVGSPAAALSAAEFDEHMRRLATQVTPAMEGSWRNRLTIARRRL